MSIPAIAGCLIAVIVIIVILRRSSETRIGAPNGANTTASNEPARVDFRLRPPCVKEIDGVGFVADMYSDETVTIEIYLKEKFGKSFALNARDGAKPELPAGERGRIAAELLALGSDYIDSGDSTDRVAAEFPAQKLPSEPGTAFREGVPSNTEWSSEPPRVYRDIVLDSVMLEKTVRLLVRLKDLKAQE